MRDTKRQWRMSATALSAFKACPTRFRLGYVEGLRKIEDTEAQRMGTNWHACLEVARAAVDSPCPVCFAKSLKVLARPDCSVCGGTGAVSESEPIDRGIALLNDAYCTVPDWADPTAWAVERVILAYSLSGYLWHWEADDEGAETIATEQGFKLPLRNPATGRALPNVMKVGKIDRLVRCGGAVRVNEYKSTSKSIDADSTYWKRLDMDTQIGLYVLAANEMWHCGDLEIFGLGTPDPSTRPSGVLYDVWHRPATRPKKLTQGDTKAFMASGEYFGATLETADGDGATWVDVGGERAEIIWGAEKKPTKKDPNPERPFAIRETPEMFGARLLADITENPDKHFARREVARTTDDLDKVAYDLYNIYQSIRTMDRSGHWYADESQCEATFKCAYCPICYNRLDVCDGQTPVDGFTRIFLQEATQ